MKARALVVNTARVVAVVVAVAALVVVPAIRVSPDGVSYEPLALAIDLAAVTVLAVVVWSVLANRLGTNKSR